MMAAIAELSQAPRTMVWVADEDDQCTDFNHSWLLWRGTDLVDDCAIGWRRALAEQDRGWVSSMHEHHIGLQRPYASTFHMTRGDGADRLVLGGASPWYATDGRFAGTVGACLDIENVRRNRRAARAIEAFYRGVLDALNEGTLTQGVDAAGRSCIQWSPLVGTSRGAGLLRLARFADSHGLTEHRERDATTTGSEQWVQNVRQQLRRGSGHEGRVAIATFELQPVSAPTDRFGHTSADDLLSVICGRMVDTVRRGDLVGQVDHHTLAVLLDGVDDLNCAEGVAETIREAVSRPVRLAGETFVPDVHVDVRLITSPADTDVLDVSA